MKIDGNLQRIDEFAFGITGMEAFAVNSDFGTGCIEVLVSKFTHWTAIYCKSKISTKRRYIKVVHSRPNLFIGCKADPDLAVGNFRVCNQGCHRTHYGGNTGFVVCTEQCSAIGDDQGFADVLAYLGIFRWTQHYAVLCVENNISTIVVFNQARFDIFARSSRAGIHMCYESNCGCGMADVGGQRGGNVAEVVKFDIFQV